MNQNKVFSIEIYKINFEEATSIPSQMKGGRSGAFQT